MCVSAIDSPAVFAALLDDRKGGRLQVRPVVRDTSCRQLYLPDSNILVTRFLSACGIAEITDFMTAQESASDAEADHALAPHV